MQTAILPASGGRAGVPKAVVMLVADKSADDVREAANEATAAGDGSHSTSIRSCTEFPPQSHLIV